MTSLGGYTRTGFILLSVGELLFEIEWILLICLCVFQYICKVCYIIFLLLLCGSEEQVAKESRNVYTQVSCNTAIYVK